MDHTAPALFVALEGSALGMAIRQSVWAYPAANVGHIVSLVLFAGAVAVMDLRLLGAFPSTPPAQTVWPARRAAMTALALQAATGFVLFTAEASHVSLNPVFQIKAALIALGIANAIAVGPALSRALANAPAGVRLPDRVRIAAMVSMATWITVAAAGRLIAYF